MTKTASEKRPWSALPLATQAAIRCGEPAFRKFLGCETKEDAADIVRGRCGVISRSELNKDPQAAQRWRGIDNEFFMASNLPECRS